VVLQFHCFRYAIQHINIPPLFLRGWSFVSLQNPLLDKVVCFRTVLKSLVDLVLKLSALQLFFRSL